MGETEIIIYYMKTLNKKQRMITTQEGHCQVEANLWLSWKWEEDSLPILFIGVCF